MQAKPLKLFAALGVAALCLVSAEWLARRTVPQSTKTPYRTARVDGLPSELEPNFETLWQGSKVRTNSCGFRGPEWTRPGPGELRVALVGDSFVFGSGIDWEDTLGVALEAALEEAGQPAQVLNCGVPGYNAGDAAVNLDTYVLPHEPDVVIYVAFANDTDPHQDWGEVDRERVPDPLRPFPLRSAFLEHCLGFARDSLAMLDVQLVRNTIQWQRTVYAGEGGERVRAALARMSKSCAAKEVPFLMAVHPFLLPPRRNHFLPVEQGMIRDGEALGLRVVGLDRAFVGYDRRANWADPAFDSHPNGFFNGLSGKLLAETLLEAGVEPKGR